MNHEYISQSPLVTKVISFACVCRKDGIRERCRLQISDHEQSYRGAGLIRVHSLKIQERGVLNRQIAEHEPEQENNEEPHHDLPRDVSVPH